MDDQLLRKATDTIVDRLDRSMEEIGFGIINSGEMKNILGNVGLTIQAIIAAYGERLDTADRLMLTRRLHRLAGVFETTVSQAYYGSFIAVSEAKTNEHVANALKSAMGDIIGTRVMFLSAKYSQSSFLTIFFQRAPCVIDRCRKEISTRSDNGILAMYTLCNLTETLASAPKEYEKVVSSLISRPLETIENLEWESLPPKLLSYVLSTLIRFGKLSGKREQQAKVFLDQIADSSPMSLSDDGRSWIFINLWHLDQKARMGAFGPEGLLGKVKELFNSEHQGQCELKFDPWNQRLHLES